MAELIRSENDLPTLRITRGRDSYTRGWIVFEVVRGSGEAWEATRCPASLFGVPDSSNAPSSIPEWIPLLPNDVISELRAAVDSIGYAAVPPHNAVWLELPSPRGYLYLLPWEVMLELGRPVIRLPYHTLRPQASASTRKVVLCASAPSAKAAYDLAYTIEQVTGAWIRHAASEVHVFADLDVYDQVSPLTGKYGPMVTAHDPRGAHIYEEPRRTRRVSETPLITSPWLQWIRDELGRQAVDVIHFISHGYRAGDRGAIALAATPTANVDTRLARFVGAPELAAFAGELGTWVFVVSGPPGNFSPAGLRDVTDAIAQLRPGATVEHELALDPGCAQLAQSLDLVLDGTAPEIPPMPAVTCWVHPGVVEYPAREQSAFHLTPAGNSALLLGSTRRAIEEPDTPTWVAAGARFLETRQADWLPERTGGVVDPAAASALQEVSSLLDRHVSRHLDFGPEAST